MPKKPRFVPISEKPKPKEGDVILTLREAAGKLAVQEETIRRWYKEGKLPENAMWKLPSGRFRINMTKLERGLLKDSVQQLQARTKPTED